MGWSVLWRAEGAAYSETVKPLFWTAEDDAILEGVSQARAAFGHLMMWRACADTAHEQGVELAGLLKRIRERARLEYARRRKPARLMVAGKRIGIDHARHAAQIVEDLARGWYETSELATINLMAADGRLVRGTRVMDFGAAIGLTAMKLADAVGDANVIAYEADPATAEDCRANLAANGHAFPIHNAAVTSGSEATVTFNASDAFVASSLLENVESQRAIIVPAVNFARELDRNAPQVIMMDVEGAEVDLLTSVTDFGPLHTICVELHPRIVGAERIAQMLEHLESHGFERQPAGEGAVALLYKRREDPSLRG